MVHHATARSGRRTAELNRVTRSAIDGDTIAAIATPAGRGGIGIVRISGPRALHIAATITGSKLVERRARHCRFSTTNGDAIDDGIALFFAAPGSFTGEDVVELQGHGGPLVMDALLGTALAAGARLAGPGEFSLRAFLNGRMDLAQAEAVADLIDASSQAAVRAAVRSLRGEFSRAVNGIAEGLFDLRCFVEAAMDFPDEEIDFLGDGEVLARLEALIGSLQELVQASRQGVIVREGVSVLLLGEVNAGKSSLLNLLAKEDAAIVTHLPGTTRDVVERHVELDGLPVKVVDTAGLRESGDEIEREGIRRALARCEEAERVLVMVDARHGTEVSLEALFPQHARALPMDRTSVLRNKIDLTGEAASLTVHDGMPVIALSVLSGAGIELLRRHLGDVVGFGAQSEQTFIARRRHVEALNRALEELKAGRKQLRGECAGELLAENLRAAHRDLGEITGKVSNDELLGRIFARFCIGK